MRVRPVLHEAENEAEAKTYDAEATKFGLDELTFLCACGYERKVNIKCRDLKFCSFAHFIVKFDTLYIKLSSFVFGTVCKFHKQQKQCVNVNYTQYTVLFGTDTNLVCDTVLSDKHTVIVISTLMKC